ncbi:MAG: bifunctional oligoribonuclease/PAP phosphatase NrnA [Sedimentisphaerales bacterium]
MADKMDFQKAVELINKYKRVLLTTHTRPDGDACGCIAAISKTLTALGKNVKILLLSELPAWYQFLFEQKPEIFSKKTKIESDLIVIVDTATYNQLPGFDEYLQESDKPILIIDHHVSSDNIGDVKLIDSSAAATALIVFDLLKYAGWPITKKIAEALFIAVSTDTGWFQFDNTDSKVLSACAELIDAGANPSRLYRDLYQNCSPQRFKLMAAMLNTLELHRLVNGKWKLVTTNYKLPITKHQLPILAVQHLTQEDFKQAGAKYSDTENLINECRRISGVEAAALFVEQANGQVKVSLRSRGSIDVCKIAQKFAGGGHKMAAGAYLPGPIENAKKLILTEIAEQFERSA